MNGTITKNNATLRSKLIALSSNNRHKLQLKWMIEIGEYIQSSGTLLPTMDAKGERWDRYQVQTYNAS